MKKISIILLILVAGCNSKNKTETKPVKIVNDTTYTIDTSNISAIQIHPERYFLISYFYKLKNEANVYNGNLWFSCDYFPSKIQIDSMAYSGLTYYKSCYAPIIIASIYEFKNKEEYMRFDDGFIDTVDHRHKKHCKLKQTSFKQDKIVFDSVSDRMPIEFKTDTATPNTYLKSTQ